MQYTEKLEDMIFEMWGDESDDISDDVISFLNDEGVFRSFGEGLTDVIEKKMSDRSLSARDYLKKLNKEQGCLLNRNTIDNWFTNNRPKKGEQSREHMYVLSFLLGLNIEETCYLFQKVYYDKAFNMRSIKEFIYYYCIKKGLPYECAQNLCAQVIQDESKQPEGTIYTQALKEDVDGITQDSELIEYIKRHPHNFQISSQSAQMIKEKLIDEILPSEADRIGLKNRRIDKDASYLTREIFISYASADLDRENGLLDKNKSLTSISTMLDIILGINMVKAQEESSVSLFKNANLPQEIMNRFPTKHTFSKENPTFEELRKMIILLFSYKFWFLKQYGDIEADIEDYQVQLDSLLLEANLPALYFGNPYDWMFLYCSIKDRPLDMFRDIMAEAFLYDDVNESYK